MYRYATEVRRLGHNGALRQRKKCTEFISYPVETGKRPAPEPRYRSMKRRLHHRWLLRCERLALQWHASGPATAVRHLLGGQSAALRVTPISSRRLAQRSRRLSFVKRSSGDKR
jgi:hypothetical protein